MATVVDFEVGELPAGGVGGEACPSASVNRKLGTGVRSFPRTMTCDPSGHFVRSSMPVISATHAPSRGSPSMLYAETSRRGRRVRPSACRGRGGIRGRSSDKNQGTRVTHRRAGHGVQAHRVSTSPLARRERTRTRRPRPRRSTLREREPGRMTRRTRPTHRRIKDLHPPVTISLAQRKSPCVSTSGGGLSRRPMRCRRYGPRVRTAVSGALSARTRRPAQQ
jgi:hypothetical protein